MFLPSHCRPSVEPYPGWVKAPLSDTAQPRDAGGLPRGECVSRDRIVRAVIKRDRDQAPVRGQKGKKKRGRRNGAWKKTEGRARGGLNKKRTFVIKSRASAETFDGIRRSTFAIRLYVAGMASEDPRQH